MKIIEQQELEKIREAGYALIDFYAEWCNPCAMFAPDFSEACEQLEKENVFCGKVNVDTCEQFAIDNGIRYIPTVILFKEGEEQNRFTGPRSKEQVLEFVHKNM